MYLKIVWHQEEMNGMTETYECAYVQVVTRTKDRPGIGRVYASGVPARDGDVSFTVNKKETTVYLLNDAGKTIDRYWGPQ